MRYIASIALVLAVLASNACSRRVDDLQFSSECIAYLQISYRADPSADRARIPEALKRAHDHAREVSRSQTGSDQRMNDYATDAVVRLGRHFGTEGKDSPELVATLREKSGACLKRFGQ